MNRYCLLLLITLTTGCVEDQKPMTNESLLPDFDNAWNFGDPVETRETFRGLLDANAQAPREWQLELMTQIARTHGLVGEFDTGHSILDEVESGLPEGKSRVRMRYLLERGRTLNSSGAPEEAEPLFIEAWEIGRDIGEDRLAIDAAHMVAIAVSGKEEATTWSLKGLELARRSKDEGARGWVGSLTNNMGWEAFDAGHLEEALDLFEESRAHFAGRELPGREQVARWAIARTKREMGQVDEAFEMQLALRAEHDEASTPDGFVYEELGELYLLKDQETLALESFRKALPLLEQERWLVDSEPQRLERIREMLADP
jgi:tetratricopeptide (TPR) repeat protein